MKTTISSVLAILLLLFCTVSASPLQIESANEAQAAKIRMALGEQYPVSKVLTIKSTTHKRAYYVGAAFHAEGVGTIVGIWIMNGSKEAPKLVFSVDGVAYQFSGMGKASKTKVGASVTDPEAKALTNALMR